MKTLVLLITLFFGIAAQAADVEIKNNQQVSRRPYAQAPAPKAPVEEKKQE